MIIGPDDDWDLDNELSSREKKKINKEKFLLVSPFSLTLSALNSS